MSNTSKLTEILRDAISDFSAHATEQTPADWLQSYLGEKLPEKSSDAIRAISGEIITTLDLMEQKKSEMNHAIECGQSAEAWLSTDIMNENDSNGSKARKAAEFLNGITRAQNPEAEIIDVETESDWAEDEWNDFRLKDALKGAAVEAGQAGLREIASDAFIKASEEGIAAVFGDGEYVRDTLLNGADTGMKVAVSAGLTIAEEREILPPTTFKVLATTAFKTVESLSAIGDAIRGKCTMTEALIHVKDTAVATFSGMWQQHKETVKGEFAAAVGTVFGQAGAAIAGAVTGFIAPETGKSRIISALKGAAKGVWAFLTKERHISIFSRRKEKAFN